MHLVLSYASALSPYAQQALSTLELPHLERLLARMAPVPGAVPGAPDPEAPELSLSTPHERALAVAWGWPADASQDGLLPMAAVAAAQDGLSAAAPGQGWGLLSPTHWHVGTEQVSLTDPAALGLDEAAARQLFEALNPLFDERDGWALHWGSATRWYVQHESLASLPTASLDRVVGRNVDLWLTAHPGARLIRRLQAEAQMLLYRHPLNEMRESQGQLPVNSFWISGTGPERPLPDQVTVHHEQRLRAPALAEDWTAWAEAWRALDVSVLADLAGRLAQDEPLQLTLCGERAAQTYAPRTLAWWQRGLLAPQRQHAAPVLTAL